MNANDTLQKRDAYYNRMAALGLTPLWRVMAETVPREPAAHCAPAFWRYMEDIRPNLIEAGDLISAEEAQRRVLILNNPSLPKGATRTLFCAMQMIKGGEIAPAHRHTQSALRLILEGEGAYTAVDGEKTYMHPGDLVVTPAWTWHDHGKETDGPMIWLDGLDIPLVNHLGATFSEEYPEPQVPARCHPEKSSALYGSGLLPVEPLQRTRHSPVFSYPYARTRAALAALARENRWDPRHGIRMMYANPLNGDHVLPTIATFIQLLPAGFRTRAWRSTESTVMVALEGGGRVRIGDQLHTFGRHDVFVIPNWTWVSLQVEQESILFSYSDRATLEKLGLFREQMES